ncbi:MAG: thiamine phosphate synthase [Pseudomonadota bacterium]
MTTDYALYLLMGPDVENPASVATAAAAGGVSIIQWRDKTGSTAQQVEAVRALVAASPVPVVVNDRADVAVAAGAAGVHVGHGDLTAQEARAVVGPHAIVGLTIHTLDEAAAADGAPIDYASVGGVFETISKHNPQPPIGIDGFKALAGRLRQGAPHPVIAVAGITAPRAEALAAAGADGVAVMSAITKAQDPAAAAHTLLTAFQKGAA